MLIWGGSPVGYLENLWNALDFGSLRDMVLRLVSVFLCLTVHETCHGLAALALGDPTAKRARRLSLNPLRHIDWFGLLMMITVGFGWAKPVPVDPRYFRRPKQGMALTALAGPVSNFLLALVLLAVVLLWVFGSNRLVLTAVHPQLASSRGVATKRNETLFTVAIAIVVTLAMSWVGLMVINSLLVLPAASSRNLARNLRQYHLLSVLSALVCGLLGLCAAYWLGCSAGATIALLLAVYFAVSFALRNRAA